MQCARPRVQIGAAALIAFAVTAATALCAPAARAATLEQTFARHTPGSAKTVDHAPLSKLLQAFVVVSADGLARVAYSKFKTRGHPELKRYVAQLETIDVAGLDRPEQFAYWANLYNAKTLDVVLDAYPVQSIKDVSLGGGLLAAVTGGPWKAKVLNVAGQQLSLDDIEHGIMRPIFKDPRVHYAVNCASIGCPNLMMQALAGATLERQLDAAARAFVNHPRGIRIAAGKVTASSIYNWFQKDFGGGEKAVLDHVRAYAEPALAQKLARITAITDYDYDWRLNDAPAA